ncbi:MAG: hypothetical protein ACR2RB_21205 [Gammaproteobacteria bacterium]
MKTDHPEFSRPCVGNHASPWIKSGVTVLGANLALAARLNARPDTVSALALSPYRAFRGGFVHHVRAVTARG